MLSVLRKLVLIFVTNLYPDSVSFTTSILTATTEDHDDPHLLFYNRILLKLYYETSKNRDETIKEKKKLKRNLFSLVIYKN